MLAEKCSFVYGRVTSECLKAIWYARKNISRRCLDTADAAVTNGFYGSTSMSNCCPDERTSPPVHLVGQFQPRIGFVASGVVAVLPKTNSSRVTDTREAAATHGFLSPYIRVHGSAPKPQRYICRYRTLANPSLLVFTVSRRRYCLGMRD